MRFPTPHPAFSWGILMTQYSGTVYIGSTGADVAPLKSLSSIVNIQKRDGDEGPYLLSGTKGYNIRQVHLNNFMESDHDFILFLDHDMVFQPDTLERLRKHKLPYVSGYYLRRQFDPMYPVWYHPFSGEWPHEPFLQAPMDDTLYPLGGSGWGCVLMHRDVVTATREILHGELEIIEDDMDVWPYDLKEVLAGRDSLRPLRGIKTDLVGSDVRFPFYAGYAGFQLIGDPMVHPKHVTPYEIDKADYFSRPMVQVSNMMADITAGSGKERKAMIADNLKALHES